ncbi:putative cystathionine beta-synthase-like [Sesbania bispinosa]|nr:putative cystathionine beta-synthase-like [Sesbania bispinosa]
MSSCPLLAAIVPDDVLHSLSVFFSDHFWFSARDFDPSSPICFSSSLPLSLPSSLLGFAS